jgi:exosortase/archaeosortase family protein
MRATGRDRRDMALARWLPGIACAVAVVALLIWAAGTDSVMRTIQGGLARIVGTILTTLGHRAVVVGNNIRSSSFGISVVTACTGLFSIGLFVAAVFVFPTRWISRLIGVGIGAVGISAMNVVRLVSLYYIGVHWPGFVDQAHQLIWQSLLIVFCVVLWLLWAGRWARAPRRI